jgi:outer membrane immunogenic protein
MKRILLSGVTIAAIAVATSASAADMAPVYKAAPAPAPAFSWTGCYVGGHVGWGWSRKKINETAFGSFSSQPDVLSSGSIDASGAVFGGQVGCNYQFSGNVVFGVEFSGSATDINGQNVNPNDANPNNALDFSDVDNFNRVKVDYLASATARLGITSGNALFYVKGGAAWTRDRWNVSDTLFGDPLGERKQSRTGWTVGGGAEWAWSFAPRWSSFVEYDYYNFGTKNLATADDVSEACCNTGDVFKFNVKQDIHVVKFGLNYRMW